MLTVDNTNTVTIIDNLWYINNLDINTIPAVTKVEECTNLEIGVGALIAAGSHLIKGHWALLVMAII